VRRKNKKTNWVSFRVVSTSWNFREEKHRQKLKNREISESWLIKTAVGFVIVDENRMNFIHWHLLIVFLGRVVPYRRVIETSFSTIMHNLSRATWQFNSRILEVIVVYWNYASLSPLDCVLIISQTKQSVYLHTTPVETCSIQAVIVLPRESLRISLGIGN
jgi:hypothetical protein